MKASRIALIAAVALPVAAAVLKDSFAQAGADKPPAPAAASSASRVAVCDMVEVFNNYLRAKDLTAQRDERLKKMLLSLGFEQGELVDFVKGFPAHKPGSKEE